MSTSVASVGIIGLGRMGRVLASGLLESSTFKKDQIFFTTRHENTGLQVEKELGIMRCNSNAELVEKCELVILAVKPQNLADVLKETASKVKQGQTFVSIVASIATDEIEKHLGEKAAVIRGMPNTPAFVGEGITPFCLGDHATEVDYQKAEAIFQALGKVVRVDEAHMNAVTGLSGCGPAYVYVILESLTEAGIKVGLPRDLARLLSAQTVLGASKMLMETGRHPAALKDEVTTPAGCTIDGLVELEEGKLRITLIKAVAQATKRAKELAG